MVVDVNVFHLVFKPQTLGHADFKPVLDWLVDGQGFLVYGGTNYNEELRRCSSYLAIFAELKKAGKVKQVNTVLVDEHTAVVKKLVNSTKCDDPHIIAIFRVSGCLLFCSKDRRADCFIKDRRLYLKDQPCPLIYRNRNHRTLLTAQNIVQIRNAA